MYMQTSKITKKIASLLIIGVILLQMPLIVFAQDVTVEQPPTGSEVVVEEFTPQTDTDLFVEPDLSGGSVGVEETTIDYVPEDTIVSDDGEVTPQDTDTVQETIPTDDLESTVNPNDEDLESIDEVVDNTSDDQTEEVDDGQDDTNQEEIATDTTEDTATEDTSTDTGETIYEQPQNLRVVSTLSVEELIPKKKYTFSNVGQTIPTKKITTINRKNGGAQAEVTQPVSVQLNNDTGIVNVSGSCSAKYYVVLLYKNVDDYDINPGSYIVNRAYDCTNGSYNYDIDRLPGTLENGTYYLLIGGMGDTGTWEPISSITPISINKF